MAAGAEYGPVPCAVAVQVGSRDWRIRICGEGLIGGLPPLTVAGERGCEALAVGVTHLAGWLDQPRVASSFRAHIAYVAVTARAGALVHRATLAKSRGTGVAKVTGV